MISQSKNRVQAIKSKFENLNNDSVSIVTRKNTQNTHLCIQKNEFKTGHHHTKYVEIETKSNEITPESDSSSEDWSLKPNSSYLYSKNDIIRTQSEAKTSLSRQTSDPGKKLHRSHAFRCDRSQLGPKRHGSCNGRSETSDFSLKMDKKLSKERLKLLGNFLEEQMKKENFMVPKIDVAEVSVHQNSIPDNEVPQNILDQYAKVNKAKKKDDKQDAMTDSGVSSETENLDDEKIGKIKKLVTQFEKTDAADKNDKVELIANLESMDDLAASSETMKLERKNPHLILTDTLKKALKQPLPTGPPPKKPPRTFTVSPIPESPEIRKKDPKKMLEKLEQVLERRKAQTPCNTLSEVTDKHLNKDRPKEIHYLCTEILDITQRTLLTNNNPSDPISRCFNSLNCAIGTSMSSLPYTRLSTHFENQETPPSFNQNVCSCSQENLKDQRDNISTFLGEKKCVKCQMNNERDDRFKCHLNCKCKGENSEFFIEKEHIYDEPFVGDIDYVKRNNYGTLNHWKAKSQSKSLEDLRLKVSAEDSKIYDIPFDPTRSQSPTTRQRQPNSDFEKLRQSFENNGLLKLNNKEKPVPAKSKPALLRMKVSKSTEDIVEGSRFVKKSTEKNFLTDTKRYRSRCELLPAVNVNTARKHTTKQLDVDRENLNRLMNEIYETVTAVCSMDENKPGSFPTEHSDGSASEESIKLTRSLTEKRKNYVRRISSRVAYLEPKSVKSRFRHPTSVCSYRDTIENPYSTFRSWKSFRTSQGNLFKEKMDRISTDSKVNLTDSSGNILSMKADFDKDSMDNISIDEKTGCVDIELPVEARDNGLFSVCLLVGLNYMTGQAYVKSVFPSQVQVPPHIENLIFPETLSSASKGEWSAEGKGSQCYSLVLTDERGERSYGYCRRVLPEGATTCLPLCYCIIGRYRAPGFYYKILQEIESRHGSSDFEIHSILQQLYETEFPKPGEDVTITYSLKAEPPVRDMAKCKTMPDMRRSEEMMRRPEETISDSIMSDYYEFERNNNGPTKTLQFNIDGRRIKSIRRPIEPRVDEDNLSILLDLLGAGLVIKLFGSLLLERKVIIIGDKLSAVSSCLEALQSSLYPFVWQQPLISAIPSEIQNDVLEAPLPILAGMLSTGGEIDTGILFEEGMLIDLTHPSKVIFYQGDESTILPTSSYKTLKTSLQMESRKHKDKQEDTKTRNVMISEAFMRFFVDILDGYWKYFHPGVVRDNDLGKDGVIFDKDTFVKSTSSKQNQYFLEWFCETAMFNHFAQNMCSRWSPPTAPHSGGSVIPATLVDTPLPAFYDLFDERIKSISKQTPHKTVDVKNYKGAVNRKVKMLKNKLRDLVA